MGLSAMSCRIAEQVFLYVTALLAWLSKVALLAAASAASFPGICECPRSHWITIFEVHLLRVSLMALVSAPMLSRAWQSN